MENKTAKIQPDWSRGVLAGHSPWNQPPALVVSDDGQHIHLAWPDNRSSGVGVHYLQLDENAQRVAEQWLGGIQGGPKSVRLILDAQGRPHVFVIARLPGEQEAGVMHWSLEADGTQPSSPRLVAPGSASFAVMAGQDGTLQVIWAAELQGDAPGLHYTRLNREGLVIDTRRLNERPALDVTAQVDHQGIVHVVWGEALSAKTWQVVYATLSEGNLQPPEGIPVEQADAVPIVGLDSRQVYILWGKQIKSGLLAGMGFIHYVAFPPGRLEARTSRILSIPASGRPEYLPYQGAYHLETIAGAATSDLTESTDLLHSPAPVIGQRDQMAVATVAAMYFGMDQRLVPTLVLFEDGRVAGYQVMAYNNEFNSCPVLAADQAGHLYAAWLTGSTGAGFRIYYAAATPSARANLDRADLTDMLVGTASLLWQMLGGVALLPFFPLIVLPALIIIVGYSIFGGGGETLDERRSYAVLILSCLAYWLAKELLLGSVLADPVIGRELTGWSRTAVVWAIQLAIAAVAGLFTARQIARKRTDSVFWSALIFIGSDMILTMLAAGPTLALRG